MRIWRKRYASDTLFALTNINAPQFKQRYLKLHGESAAPSVAVKKPQATKLRRSVVRQDESNNNSTEIHVDPLKPWLDEYQQYLTAREVVPEGMDTIQWWGVSEGFISSSLH